MSARGLFFIALTILFTVAGQLLVKKGTGIVGAAPAQLSILPRYLLTVFSNLEVVLGLGSAVLAAACWTVAVSRTALSVAYPFMALAIVLVLALSTVSFGEQVNLRQWMGVAIVCAGLLIASGR